MSQLRFLVDRSGLHQGTPWVVLNSTHEVVQHGVGLAELPPVAEVLVIIPDDCVTLVPVSLPKLSKRHLRSALPASVEDQLMTAVEDTELVLLHHRDDGVSTVAAWSREWRLALLKALTQLNIPAVRVVAESWGLPLDAGTTGLLVTGQRCVLRRPDTTTLVDDFHGGLSALMERALGETNEPRQVFIAPEKENRGQTPISGLMKLGSVPDFLPFDWRTATYPPETSLYQHRYRPLDSEAAAEAFRLPVMLAALWLMLELIALAVQSVSLRQERSTLRAAQEQIFVGVFGNETPRVDAERQLKQKLDALRAAAGEPTASDFVALMTRLATQFPQSSPLTEISYQGGQLNLHGSEVKAGPIWRKAALDAGLSAQLEASTESANGMRLRIAP